MLRIGYALLVLAGLGLLGYAGTHAVAALIAAPGISMVVKVLILCAALGVLLTLFGLWIEKRREAAHAARDNEHD